MPAERDHVDWALTSWRRERPDLDTSSRAVTLRIARSARHIERAIERIFAEFGLTPHEFHVLGVLRRAGAPNRMSPTELGRTLLITAAAVTNRVSRLERAGLVTRVVHPSDRRALLVELTPKGLELADRALEAHVAAEQRAVTALTKDEQKELARLLRKLLLAFGDTPPVQRTGPSASIERTEDEQTPRRTSTAA